MIYADERRIGNHGIGRFARELLAELDYIPVSLETDPDSPFDSIRLAQVLSHLTSGDLFFSPGYNPPLYCKAPFIFTLHDLNHLDRPENSSFLKRLYYATVIRRACHTAARILTVSEFSRRRIIDWSGVSPSKVVTVSCGVGKEFRPDVAPYGLSFPYLLCVSNRRGHKNEFRQVEAFAKSGIDNEIKLVFTGYPTTALTSCIEKHHIAHRVHFVGMVPDSDLPSLYKTAIALIFVSLYEGFGIPVLEAMACGTPVITSNSTALPEVAGGAALLVDPLSMEEIADATARIVNDSALRSQLRAMGQAKAAMFSWEDVVKKVRILLEDPAHSFDK